MEENGMFHTLFFPPKEPFIYQQNAIFHFKTVKSKKNALTIYCWKLFAFR